MTRLSDKTQLLELLSSLDIEFENRDHPPVFTVEEARLHTGDIPGGHCKNLFLRDRKKNLYLIVTLADKPINLKELTGKIGAKGLQFGKPDLLETVLGVKPGSVTPFGVVNAAEHDITVVLDEEMMEQQILNFHPLENSATTTIASGDLLRFMDHCEKDPVVVRI